jgi:hypothetical protein
MNPEAPDWQTEFLKTGILPGDNEGIFWTEKAQRKLWKERKEEILPAWIRKYPGTRPHAWWNLDGKNVKQRARVGGVGRPVYDYLSYLPKFKFGIPVEFVTKERAEMWMSPNLPQRLRTEMEAVDPKDPPTFESEAAFLDRHELLTPAEKKKLSEKDFEPVRIKF